MFSLSHISTEHRRAAAEQSTTKLEKAIKSYEETLKRFPNSADAHALYAQVNTCQKILQSIVNVMLALLSDVCRKPLMWLTVQLV